MGVCSSKANRMEFKTDQTMDKTKITYITQVNEDHTDNHDVSKGSKNAVLLKRKRFKKNDSTQQDNTSDINYCSHLINAYINDVFHQEASVNIPDPIRKIVSTYCPLKYRMYAIHHKSIDHKKNCETLPTFHRLKSAENILKYCGNIYPSNNAYIMKKDNKIYRMRVLYNQNKPKCEIYHGKQHPNYHIQHIESGKHHTLIKLQNGSIYTSAKMHSSSIFQKINIFGKDFYKLFSRNNQIQNIIAMECGLDHSLLLTDTGRVYSIGVNDKGQCGLGDVMIPFVSEPTLISKFVDMNCKIKSISCGDTSSCCVDQKAHYLWCWGDTAAYIKNKRGSGYVSTPNIYLLSTISDANINIIKAKCGKRATVALDKNGHCYVLGQTMIGRTRLNKNIRFIDFDIAPNFIILISENNNIYKLNTQWNNRARNISKLDSSLFPNLKQNSAMHSVLMAGNTTIIIFH